MAIINGVDVAQWECDQCKGREMWLFRGQGGEGYNIVCATCFHPQAELREELQLHYLWANETTYCPNCHKYFYASICPGCEAAK